MDEAVGGSVGYALAIAISPIPIAALILTLLSVRPRSSSIAFTTGWIAGIGAVASIAVATGLFDAGDEPSDRRGWIRLTIGAILVLAAVRRWRTRPGPDEVRSTPPLMRAIDGAGPRRVLGIGFALAALNPKDMLLAAAGGAEIASTDLSDGSTVATLVVFTMIAASTAIIPVGTYLVSGDRLDDRLHHARDALIRYNPVVMAVVLAAVGALFVAEGIQILWG